MSLPGPEAFKMKRMDSFVKKPYAYYDDEPDATFPNAMAGDICCRKFWYKVYRQTPYNRLLPINGHKDEVCSIWVQCRPATTLDGEITDFSSFLRMVQIDYGELLSKYHINDLELRFSVVNEFEDKGRAVQVVGDQVEGHHAAAVPDGIAEELRMTKDTKGKYNNNKFPRRRVDCRIRLDDKLATTTFGGSMETPICVITPIIPTPHPIRRMIGKNIYGWEPN